MSMNDETINISNEALMDIGCTLGSAADMVKEIAYNIDGILVADEETTKKRKRTNVNMLFILGESLDSLEMKLSKLINEAGGEY